VKLSRFDLEQIDDTYLEGWAEGALRTLTGQLLADLKEAHDRLHQGPSNRSRPPSSAPPWGGGVADPARVADGPAAGEDGDGETDGHGSDAPRPPEERRPAPRGGSGEGPPSKPGRRKGARGPGRTPKWVIDVECLHRPTVCAGCTASLPEEAEQRAYAAYDEIGAARATPGSMGCRPATSPCSAGVPVGTGVGRSLSTVLGTGRGRSP
jgi:hypothetical protein